MSRVYTIAAVLTLSLLWLEGGCALLRGTRPQRLPDGAYRVSCASSLDRCLASLAEVCPDGYEIVHATEKRSRSGPPPAVTETITSEAVVRCRQAESLFRWGAPPAAGSSAAPDGGAQSATPPSPVPSGCVPGISQACVGPGGCRGGQACAADGRAFGPCDCGTSRDGGTLETRP